MGFLNNLSDSITNAITKKETLRLPYEQMAQLVKDFFITGADDAYLDKVKKEAKGGMLTNGVLDSADGRYQLKVMVHNRGIGTGRAVWIYDNQANKFYQLDKDHHFRKFYAAVEAAVNMEKINRNK